MGHDDDVHSRIAALKESSNAIILAHNYQNEEVQAVADIVGDSLALSRAAANTAHDVIVFCGVHFMAETAAILAPDKTVLLPASDAGCPLADMATPEMVREMRAKYPEAAVVCYVNTSAAVKAECDYCCTSANAVQVCRAVPARQIIMLPDCNLAAFVASQLPEKEIVVWQGHCVTHHRVKPEDILAARAAHPEAPVLVHPECQQSVAALADFVGSTSQILRYARESSHKTFIIGTEMGIITQLRLESPDKVFYLASPGLVCPNMKRTRLSHVLAALENMAPRVTVDEPIRSRARLTLDRMFQLTR